MNVHRLTEAFNSWFQTAKTETAIHSALSNNKIRCGRKVADRFINRIRLFTEEQINFIKENYTGRSVEEMTDIFNARYGIARTRQQMKTFVSNRSITSGLTGRFPQGHKPWNGGTKGQGLTSANKGSFKKGNNPPNRKPVGSERVDANGFIYIKVAERDPYTGFTTRYKLKHVHVWEQAHGPVPKGMVVAFINSDQTCCEDENLMLISRAELLNLNQHGYREIPDELKPSVRALSKLQVKTWAKEKTVLRDKGI